MWLKLLANKYVLGAIGVLVIMAAIWGYGRHRYNQGVSDAQTAVQLAAYEQYQSEIARINSAQYDLQNKLTELQNAKPTVITQYRDRVVQVPLPDSCRIDDGRLHNIQSAVNAARVTR